MKFSNYIKNRTQILALTLFVTLTASFLLSWTTTDLFYFGNSRTENLEVRLQPDEPEIHNGNALQSGIAGKRTAASSGENTSTDTLRQTREKAGTLAAKPLTNTEPTDTKTESVARTGETQKGAVNTGGWLMLLALCLLFGIEGLSAFRNAYRRYLPKRDYRIEFIHHKDGEKEGTSFVTF